VVADLAGAAEACNPEIAAVGPRGAGKRAGALITGLCGRLWARRLGKSAGNA